MNPGVREVFRLRRPADPGGAGVPGRPRVPGGRDARHAVPGRGRDGAPLRDAPQRARHPALPPHRAGAPSEAPGRGRRGPRLRDRPDLPERGRLDPAQPRVHHARVLSGVRRLRGPDGADRVPVRGAGPEAHRRARAHLSGRADRPDPALAATPLPGRGGRGDRARAVRARRPGARPGGGAGGGGAAGRRRGRLGLGRRHARLPDVEGRVRDLRRADAGPADLRHRLPDGALAARAAEAGRPEPRRPVRAVRRPDGDGERVLGAQRPARAAAAVRAAAPRSGGRRRGGPPAWTRTTSARWSTACRRPPARGSGSTG